jgi:tetratricopeptide (TPR) repeat protein
MRYFRPLILAAATVLLCGTAIATPATRNAAVATTFRVVAPGAGQPPVALPATPYQALEGPLGRLEVDLFADAADGRLHRYSLLAAALVASGVDRPETLRDWEARLDAMVDELRETFPAAGTPQEQARAIFEFMHRRILVAGYSRNCTELAEALEQGHFNCVSATVLFNCLAERFGLRICGLETPGHALSRLILPEGRLDVETTCPRWFELAHDPRRQAELVQRTLGTAPAGASPRGPCREVCGPQLAAMIYYNRGVDRLAEQRFADALADNAKALRLDAASVTARGNLLAALNNWAIALASDGRYTDACRRLEEGLSFDPGYEAFSTNYAHVYYEWVESLAKAGRYEDALDTLDRGVRRLPGNPYFRSATLDLYRRWIASQLAAGEVDEAWAVLGRAEQRLGRTAELADAAAAEFNSHALALLAGRRFEEAVLFLDGALARWPRTAALADNHRIAVMRWAEPAFHQGDYAEAIRRTTYGATPGQLHPSLLGNLRYGYYHWIEDLRAAGETAAAEQVAARAHHDPFLSGSDQQVGAEVDLTGPAF